MNIPEEILKRHPWINQSNIKNVELLLRDVLSPPETSKREGVINSLLRRGKPLRVIKRYLKIYHNINASLDVLKKRYASSKTKL